MKLRVTSIVCAGLIFATTWASAQPPGKGPKFRRHKSLQTVEDVESLKKGDKIGLVCLQCHTVSELTVEGTGDAALLCKEGAKVDCPSCKKTYKVAYHGQKGSKGSMHRRVKYVNDQGEECAFISRLQLQKKDDRDAE